MNDDCFEPRSHKMPVQVHLKLLWSLDMDSKGNLFQEIVIDIDNNPSNKNTWRVWTECAGNPVYPQGVLGFMIKTDGALGKLLMLMNLT